MDEEKKEVKPNSVENLSKEELLNKYKSLLNIAKKAKQSKDELFEENRQLKETLSQCENQKQADKQSLLTMKEMLEQFTENKLQLTTKLNELQTKSKTEEEAISSMGIENESLKRQMNRLTEDNDSLLADIDRMENQLKQVNLLGIEQKKHLELLELEINKLKQCEQLNITLNAQLEEQQQQHSETKKSLEDLKEKYQHIKFVNSEQRQKFNSLKDRFVEVHKKLTKLKECKRILLETQKEYADSVSRWQNEIIAASHQLCAQMNALKQQNEQLQMEKSQQTNGEMKMVCNINLNSVSEKLQVLYDLGEKALQEQKANDEEKRNIKLKLEHVSEKHVEFEDLSSLVASEKHINDELNKQLQKLELTKETMHQELQQTQEIYRNKIEEISHERDSSLHQLSELRVQHSEIHLELQQIRDIIKALEEEKSQLLNELKSNKTSKSKQAENQQSELEECRQAYGDLMDSFQLKEREHTDLLAEMRELNEALKARGDVISRQQEKQQELITELKKTNSKLQQLEQQLTEKEQSLNDKNEQVKDINLNIEIARQQVQNLESTCSKHEQQVKHLSEELQNLRADKPVLDDGISDILSTSTVSRAEELNRLKELDEGYEEKYNKLKSLAMKLRKKLQEQTLHIKELEDQPKAPASNTNIEFEELKKKVQHLQHDQEQGKRLIETLKTENQKLKSSRKQSNVLNLEIEAAEKSLAEVSTKLQAKVAEVDSLNQILTTKESCIEILRKEMSILESAKEAELVHSKELKVQIDRLQNELKDALHGKQTAQNCSKDLEQEHESYKRELEALKMQLAHSDSKHQSQLTKVLSEKENLQHQLQQAELQLENSQQSLKTAQIDVEDIRLEYTDYKIKAQSVLRKNQSKDSSKDQEMQEEILALKAAEKQLKTQAEIQQQENVRQLDLLKEDNARLQKHSAHLQQLIEELRLQTEQLAQENRQMLQGQQESLKNQRQQIESLDICHKKQIQELQLSHQQQIEQMHAELRQANLKQSSTSAVSSAVSSEQLKFGYQLMEREDAEGSEAETLNTLAANRKISNTSSRGHRRSSHQHDFIPLDELLNASMQSISDTVVTTSFSADRHYDANDNNDSHSHLELQSTKALLQKAESRVRHLTALLSENEQDLAKLTQMNDMLKEELRRQERGVEREKHMHNSEYLKNVFLKFLTLNNGDERIRLVPVLNTILKLSRSEVELLNCVAKGQKLPSDGNKSGWSNFLSWGQNN